MGKIYTEQENTWAAMISNCRITDIQIGWAQDMFSEELGDDGIPTFAQIVAACKKEGYELWFREPTEGEQKFFDDAIDENIDPPLDYANWKIVGIYDDNDNSGFYGLAIETGEYTRNGVENGVILSTRGTEPILWEQWYLDLVNADLNIINSDVTEQEQVLHGFIDNQFASLLAEKQYSNLATAGHSLGGYLAFSAAAHIAADTNSYAYKIFMQGTNIDGPGVTEENLAEPVNQAIYAEINDRLTHYHYTYVRETLIPIFSNYIVS